MSEQIKLRRGRAEDAKWAADLARQVFAGVAVDYYIEQYFGSINGTHWDDRKAEQIRAEVAACPEAVVIAERDGEFVGFVTTAYDQATRIGRIPNLAVKASEQGRGVGKKLMQAAYELLTSQGATHLQIETLESNTRGMSFYPKLGFREITRKIYYFMEVEQWQPPD
ncbi:MAG: GNAT family N-acetyltransferase [Armatimonadota bacterium]